MENKEKEKCTPKSFKIRPSTQEEINLAISADPGRTTDEVLYDMAHAYNLAKRGKSLTSHTDDMKRFTDCIDLLKSMYCTALESGDAMQAAMQDRYDQLIQNAQNSIVDLTEKEKSALEALEKAEKETATYKKETDAALQRVHDLEDKVTVLAKATEISDARITDLTAQLSTASEKASQYDVLLEENRAQATRIRDLEEEVRALTKDLEHEKETLEQRIRIIQLEAGKKDTKASEHPADEAVPKDINIVTELPFD